MNKSFLIFLVDDDTDDQEIFIMALQQVNPLIQCVFADDGIHAIEKLKNGTSFYPDIIFLDINMPRMNGIQCLLEIKKLPHTNGIPVYMYSTSDEKSIVEECLKIGAAGFLKKEINIEDLQKQVLEVLATI
jgi:CheY-like chemotaxis protein